jgi:hypothetical protein
MLIVDDQTASRKLYDLTLKLIETTIILLYLTSKLIDIDLTCFLLIKSRYEVLRYWILGPALNGQSLEHWVQAPVSWACET